MKYNGDIVPGQYPIGTGPGSGRVCGACTRWIAPGLYMPPGLVFDGFNSERGQGPRIPYTPPRPNMRPLTVQSYVGQW